MKKLMREVDAQEVAKAANEDSHVRTPSKQTVGVSDVTRLQRTIGNQAVQQFLEAGAVQTKLKVGRPADAAEVEADREAEVVAASSSDSSRESTNDGALSGNDSGLHRVSSTLHRSPSRPGLDTIPPIVEEGLRSPGQPLDKDTLADMEKYFGHDLSDVRVHANAKAAESAQAVRARAYTVGNDIVLGKGQNTQRTVEGKKLLAHELTHVVQQRQGGAPSLQRWVLPTDWLDYIGLAIDVGERIYIELHYGEGQEKDFKRFVNNLIFVIDLIFAALPGAGGGGLAMRASHGAAVMAWHGMPATAKVRVTQEVATRLGWSVMKAAQMINLYMSAAKSPGEKGPAKGSSASKGEKGPSGQASTEKYLEKRWDKGTFGNVEKSIEYHVAKHGKGLSKVEYTQRAEKAFADLKAVKSSTGDLQGREAVKVVSEQFGTGLFTPTGKIIWFHPK